MIVVAMSIEKASIFKQVGGMLVMVLGVYTLFPGYDGISHANILGLSLGTTSIGLGFYFLIIDFLSLDRQVERFDQYDDGRFHEND